MPVQIAWSNFFSRLTHSHPGRVVWLVFNGLVAFAVDGDRRLQGAGADAGALFKRRHRLVGALVSDLVVNKPLGLRPPHMEFKRAHLYDINPVCVGAMTIATIVSISAFYGVFGPTAKALAPFVALVVAFVTAPLIAFATGGKYYIARKPKRSWQNIEAIKCCICEHTFEPEDMASAPPMPARRLLTVLLADARCHDLCSRMRGSRRRSPKPSGKMLPQPIYARSIRSLATILGVFAVSAGLVGLTLGLIYLQTQRRLVSRICSCPRSSGKYFSR